MGKQGLAVLAFILLPALAAAQGAWFASSADSLEIVETGLPGVSFEITSSPTGASVEIDGKAAGKTPLDSDGWEAGSHRIVLSLKGHREKNYGMLLLEGSRLVIHAVMEPILGTLAIEANPSGAEILVDGKAAAPGLLTLPVGDHDVTARLFGYRTAEDRVSVNEYIPARLVIDLEPAPFSLGDAGSSRTPYNPSNPGKLGRTNLSFTASAPGSARLSVTGPGGVEVLSREYAELSGWENGFEWSGRADDGTALPDGEYLMAVEGMGDDGVFSRVETSFMIDSSSLILVRDGSSGSSGFILSPDSRGLPQGSTEVRLSALLSLDGEGGLPLLQSMRFGLPRGFEASLGAWAHIRPSGPLSVALQASIKWAWLHPGPFGGALFLQGSFVPFSSAITIGPQPLASSIDLGGVLGVSPGVLDAGLAPRVGLSFADGLGAKAGLSAYLGLQFRAFDIHLSADSALELGGAFAAEPLGLALDARLLIPPSIFSLNLGIGTDLPWSGGLAAAGSPWISLGMGMIF